MNEQAHVEAAHHWVALRKWYKLPDEELSFPCVLSTSHQIAKEVL